MAEQERDYPIVDAYPDYGTSPGDEPQKTANALKISTGRFVII
jgi:hypothetical protein